MFESEIENVVNILSEYKGKTLDELKKTFNFFSCSKAINNLLVRRILEARGYDSTRLSHLDIVIKALKINKTGKLKEAVSLPAFDFADIYNKERESSDLRKFLTNSTFIFVIFKEEGSQTVLYKVFSYNFDYCDIELNAADIYNITREIIRSGEVVNRVFDGRYLSNFPTEEAEKVIHVRPHARNFNDTSSLPVPDKLTGKKSYMKHSFWINRKFVQDLIDKKE